MVTAVTVLVLGAAVAPEPLAARTRHHRSHAAPVEERATKPKDAIAASQVPLPQPRPAGAPPHTSTETAKGKDAPSKGDAKDNAKDNGKDNGKNGGKEEAAAPEPQPPSACRLALTDQIAIAPSIPAIHGPGACGGDDLVRLEAVVLPDKTRVALTPPGIMRCTMATAVVNWIRNDVAPEIAKLGSEIKALDNFDSYECRSRNGDSSAKLSEHGRANAIDVHGFKLADGRMIELTDRSQPREFREAVLHSACTRFPTVLGPDSDWHHEDHIHLDLIERRSNYRICQWDVLDPMPKVAPLMPEQRPDGAPPRQVAEAPGAGGKAKDQAAAKSGDAKGNDTKGNDTTSSVTGGTSKGTSSTAGEAKTGYANPQDSKAGEAKAGGAKIGADKQGKEQDKAAKQDAGPGSGKLAGETRGESAAPDRPSATKPAKKATGDNVGTERSSPGKAASGKSSPEKASSENASHKKIAADRPPRRHRHRSRMWNPFASFF